MSIHKHLAVLKTLRILRGKTQEEVAREIGVSRVAISFWENRRRNPSKEHIEKLIRIFSELKEGVNE